MSDDGRPSAAEMLARTIGEQPGSRGRLRVYLGMAPGVGKTYRMLEEGHRRLERGTDVVVGFVETHGRPTTAALLEGLEIVPRRHLEYRGVVVEEMDGDAVIARRPEVALIDELAHTNAPGSQHEKRWQDVERIRDAGIDVVSTCNIQHLESVADAVATITGAPVNERLPDAILAAADEVELIDMSPHALRQRMRHGNVYPPDRASIALDRFFTEPNLTALRELALRFVTGRVDAQLGAVGPASDTIARLAERILVLVDGAPSNARAIRRAADLAGALRAPLLAAVVETPIAAAAPSTRRRALREHLDDAIDLGAEVIEVEATDVAAALAELVQRRRVTRVVLGHTPRGTLDRLRGPSLEERLLALRPGIEIHLVAEARDVRDAFRAGQGE